MKIDNKIEKYFIDSYDIDINKEYDIILKDPNDILNINRIDLIPKILLLKAKNENINSKYFYDLYKASIEAFSSGRYAEPGKEEKNSIKVYINQFAQLEKSISTKGINQEISIIPIGSNGAIIDGGHRAAISIYYNHKIPTVLLPNINVSYDLYYFKNKLMDRLFLDYMCLQYIKQKKNIHAICIWPKCSKEQQEYAFKKIKENLHVIYDKQIKFNINGLKNFMIQVYKGQSWIGNFDNNFFPVEQKMLNCYGENFTKIIFVEESNNDKILKVKKEIRDKIGFENHSLHSTDTYEETLSMAELVLNDNSIDFLNTANIIKYPKTFEKINKLKEKIKKLKISYDDIVIDSGCILSLYGLRECDDIDFFVGENIYSLNNDIKNIETHNTDSDFYEYNFDEYIYNPNNHFNFIGLKFMTLKNVKKVKEKRNANKDLVDIVLINSVNNNSKNKDKYLKIVKYKRIKRNIIVNIKKILKKTFIYEIYKMYKKGKK